MEIRDESGMPLNGAEHWALAGVATPQDNYEL
jgi:hypothetical protein